MTWTDRIREAAYTSPSGTRLTFEFTNVRREVDKRTSVFEFPGVDEAYVQDNGRGPRRFPMRCYFTGADHDLAAEEFEEALLERGVGRLEHPFYGTFDVVPLGRISRRDDLVDAAGQTILEVTFSTSLASIYPQPQVDLRAAVTAALLALAEASATQFESAVDLGTEARRQHAAAAVRDEVNAASSELESLTEGLDEVRTAFRDAERELNRGLDVLIGQPLQLARNLANLIALPARAASGLRDRLDGYSRLLERILDTPRAAPWDAFGGSVVLPGRRQLVANDFHISAHSAAHAVAGAVQSAVEHQFRARPAALDAAALLLGRLDVVVAWQDRGFAALQDAGAPDLDIGERYQALQEAVALAAGYLVEISFTLVPERRIVLDRPRTILDLAAELYGAVDERLDFLIETNELVGSEILELPRGREIVYYA